MINCGFCRSRYRVVMLSDSHGLGQNADVRFLPLSVEHCVDLFGGLEKGVGLSLVVLESRAGREVAGPVVVRT